MSQKFSSPPTPPQSRSHRISIPTVKTTPSAASASVLENNFSSSYEEVEEGEEFEIENPMTLPTDGSLSLSI
jgi:hypothetical protein